MHLVNRLDDDDKARRAGAMSPIAEVRLDVQAALNLSVLGFAEEARGEIYLLANSTGVPLGTTGVVLKLVPAAGADDDARDD